MVEHNVRANLQVIELTKRGSAITFEIFADDGKLGEIEIGKGTFGWKSVGKQNFQTLDWTNFCKMLNRYFYEE